MTYIEIYLTSHIQRYNFVAKIIEGPDPVYREGWERIDLFFEHGILAVLGGKDTHNAWNCLSWLKIQISTLALDQVFNHYLNL